MSSSINHRHSQRFDQMRCTVMVSLFFFCVSHFALAQIPPDRNVLLNGEGAGQAKYAEMNGYPGPKHVLELADKLTLRDDQKKAVQGFFNEMETRAKEVGKQIVRVEQELHDAFVNGLVSEKSIRSDAEEIGRLRGKLRAIHLTAHLKTKGVLTEDQIRLYRKLRSESGGQKK